MTLLDANLEWLLDSDPTLRWQVERDLLAASGEIWMDTRSRVATEGFGARLLALQDEDGQWAGGAYFPGRKDPRVLTHGDDQQGQPYTATTWALNTLREWGVASSSLVGTAEKLSANSKWEYDDSPYWKGEVDCCINAYTLANGVWLGANIHHLKEWFLEHQLADGGWNCQWIEGSTRSSFHSTLNSLIGLLWYETSVGGNSEMKQARHKAQEYLLERKLLYSASTGERVGPWVADFAYPFRWSYNVLRALDYFRLASLLDNEAPDPRLADAVSLVQSAGRSDGRWEQGRRHPGETWFEVDVPVGQASPWLTFYATRVLNWWNQ